MWVGNVEIHNKASDWKLHHHDSDKAYDTVVLHVVSTDDAQVRRTTGELVPQLVLNVPKYVMENSKTLLASEKAFPCLSYISYINRIHLLSWQEALLGERLENKAKFVMNLLDLYRNDWNEVLYIVLSRNFGFGVNGDALEMLAKSLPLRFIRKQSKSQTQVEALLFGQAGMLGEEKIDPYHRLLRREYLYLQHKFELKPIEGSAIRCMRIRPNGFPSVKLAQLAAILGAHDTLFSLMIEARTPGELKELFRVSASDFWTNRYNFDKYSKPVEKRISETVINNILINTVVPVFMAYGKFGHEEYIDRAFRLIMSIPPEENAIVRRYKNAGFSVSCAGDSQALIELSREYCEKKKCLSCRVGYNLLKLDKLLVSTNIFLPKE